jgi:hypothetical protein
LNFVPREKTEDTLTLRVFTKSIWKRPLSCGLNREIPVGYTGVSAVKRKAVLIFIICTG